MSTVNPILTSFSLTSFLLFSRKFQGKIQNLLRRQDSGSSPEKQDGLDEYGNNLGNIEDDSSASGPIDDSEVEIIKYNWLLESARDSIDLFKDFEQQYFTKHN